MIYDTIIIGGGPAGMMAAIWASENGASVLLLEKNNDLGLKLLITGHGRCNLTNLFADEKNSLSVYGANYKFLFSSFSQFGVDKTLDFFRAIGIDTKIEDKGRVFPKSEKALDVRTALNDCLKKNNVKILFDAGVKDIVAKKNIIEKVVLNNNQEYFVKNFIIATGGKSYPGTGSSGDAYAWLEALGHTVNVPRPALAPIEVNEKIVKELEGLSLKDVEISIFKNNKKIISKQGDMIFTADGLSGPAIIDMSSTIGKLLPEKVFLKIDFFPTIMADELEGQIQNDFHRNNGKMLKNYLASLISQKLIPVLLKLSCVNGEKPVDSISKTERKAIVSLLKELTFTVKQVKGFDKAMVTAGGIDTKEIDPKTMCSRFYKNLYLAGEVLDLDGPSGGYNLQICWSTGYVAGVALAKS